MKIHSPSTGKIIDIFCPFKILVKIPQSDFTMEFKFAHIGVCVVSYLDELVPRSGKGRRPRIEVLKYILLKQHPCIRIEPLRHKKVHLDRAMGIADI